MSSANLSFPSRAVARKFYQSLTVSLAIHKPVTLTLFVSAAVRFVEFIICVCFFAHTASPYFVAPIPTLLNGEESFLYAHSIIRQYGFFAGQLAVLTIFIASHPARYRPFISLLALSHLLVAGLGVYVYLTQHLLLAQLLPSLCLNVLIAGALWRWQPEPQPLPNNLDEMALCTIFGFSLPAQWQQGSLRLLCLIAGGLWVLWGLGSTVFWEIGTAQISSDRTMAQNLLAAMQANSVVRNQQGMMLLSIGLITAWAARHPFAYQKIIDFVMVQQVINALSAVVELWFGAIIWSQFLTVFSAQVLTLTLFWILYPLRTIEKTKSELASLSQGQVV
ncbi:MAG: hypothetical protein RMI34_01080 [Chloroherpetonaceae bacterium]|nr:hypothetical protein [Chloroherpetonaceae bacterium]